MVLLNLLRQWQSPKRQLPAMMRKSLFWFGTVLSSHCADDLTREWHNDGLYVTIDSIHCQRNPHRERGLAGMGNGCFAEFCCCVPLCPCELRYSSSKDISFHRFPGDKVAGRECIFKAVMICLYCERFAGKFDVDSSRNRIDTSPEKKTNCLDLVVSLESWMIGDMLSVYGEIKI